MQNSIRKMLQQQKPVRPGLQCVINTAIVACCIACMQPIAASGEINFQRDVLPLLQEHCVDCHGPNLKESNLRLDSPAGALQGGDSGEQVIVPGKSDSSYLVELLTTSDLQRRMPKDAEPLSQSQIALLRSWIDDAPAWKMASAELAARKVEHWSFRPAARPPLPGPAGSHPVDAFVAARLRDAGLTMAEEASRRRLIRRLYLVMHGLPPTPQEVRQFLEDQLPSAWEQLVDRVLASPRYGERWATHWLDLVRFGETTGFETNRERPTAWHYRDWVIRALNDDKPYDQFIIEQLAGDAVGADAATGFLVAGPNDIVKGQDGLLEKVQRQDELADIINTTGTAFLGMTLGCARCHNHKFDPVTQSDYYSLQAVFAGVQHAERPLPAASETKTQVERLNREVAGLEKALAMFTRGKGTKALRPAVNFQGNVEEFTPVSARFVRFTINASSGGQPCIDELEVYAGEENVGLATAGAKPSSSGDFVHPLHKLEHINDGRYGNPRSWIASQESGWVQLEFPKEKTIDRVIWGRDREGLLRDRLAIDYRVEVSSDAKTWKVVAQSADRMPFSDAPTAAEYDFSGFPQDEAIRGRGQWELLKKTRQEREELSRPTMAYAGTFSQPGATHRLYRGEPTAPREAVSPGGIRSLTSLKLSDDAPEQQRRLAIAKWIADASNPLTARVIVNRLWQHHFGTGLVDTPSDFGANGSSPSHPELLDWLAAELVDHGWSLKHIHRLLLTSTTWRQDSRSRGEPLQVDAASRLLWRFPPRRLDAEGIRDSMLAVTGKLDLRMGGPGFSAFEIEMENVRHYFPKKQYGPEDWRRMIYMTKVRQERDSVFGLFDCPDNSQVVPSRSRSTTPLQALNLLNSMFVVEQSGFLVQRLEREAANAEEKIALAYELCYSRPPEAEEVAAALEFIQAAGWQQFARALLNSSEFVFVP